MVKEAVLFFTLVNVLAFAWSVVGVFIKDKADWRLNLLKVCAPAAGGLQLWQIYISAVPTYRGVVALVFLMGALALYAWAVLTIRKAPFTLAFSVDQPRRLERNGPYRYIRNPFYTAYLTTYGTGVVATLSWVNWAVFLAMTALYVNAVKMEEDKFISSPLAEEYYAYRTTTGRFLPRLSLR